MMADVINITVPGPPRVWMRAGRYGKRSYTPAGAKKYKKRVQQYAALAMRGLKPLEGPVRMDVVVAIQKPKDPTHKMPIGKNNGDIDNHAKAASDALNGIVYVDDAQVCLLVAKKVYAPEPSTIIVVRPYVERATDIAAAVAAYDQTEDQHERPN